MAMEVRLGKSWVVGSLTLHWASSNIAWSPSLFLVPFSWYFLWRDRLGMVVCSGVFMGFWCGLQRRVHWFLVWFSLYLLFVVVVEGFSGGGDG